MVNEYITVTEDMLREVGACEDGLAMYAKLVKDGVISPEFKIELTGAMHAWACDNECVSELFEYMAWLAMKLEEPLSIHVGVEYVGCELYLWPTTGVADFKGVVFRDCALDGTEEDWRATGATFEDCEFFP